MNPIAQLLPEMFEEAAHPKLAPPTVRSESRSAANREGEFQQPARAPPDLTESKRFPDAARI